MNAITNAFFFAVGMAAGVVCTSVFNPWRRRALLAEAEISAQIHESVDAVEAKEAAQYAVKMQEEHLAALRAENMRLRAQVQKMSER